MAPILLNQLRGIVTSPLISIFCRKFQENEIVLRKSIDTSICVILIGLDNLVENTILYNKIIESITLTEFYKTLEFESGKLSSINYCFEEEGFAPLNMIFSAKKGRISEMISNEVGVKSETASAILNFAVMLILSHFKNENQKAKIIKNDLNSEKTVLLNIVPDGIRVILGYPNFQCDENDDSFEKTNLKSRFFTKLFNI